MGQIPRANGYIIQLVQGARRVRGFLHGFGSSLVMRLCEGFSDGFRSQNLDLVVGFKHFLFIDELHHFSRWLLHHQPVTTSYFQFLLSPPRTQFWNLLSSHSMSAFSLVHGQCLAVQLTILPEQSCLGCWYALDMCLVGGLEHGFYSPIIYGIILLPLTNSYFSEG